MASYEKAIQSKPDYAAAYSNCGNALGYLGHLEEAVGSFQRALDVKPDFSVAFSNLLFTKGYLSDESPDDLLLEAMKCGALIRQQCTTFRVDRSFSTLQEEGDCAESGLYRRIGEIIPWAISR